MHVDERVTRRSFLRGLVTAAAGAGLNSFIPLPLATLKKFSPGQEVQPYWLEVLSKGMGYFPAHIVSRYSSLPAGEKEESARVSLFLTLGRNRNILSSGGLPGVREMDEAVELNKGAQYLYESMRYDSGEKENEDEDTLSDDTCYARLLYDLSCFILRDIMGKVEAESFAGFSPFDLALLGSGVTYARESIRMNEMTLDPGDEDIRKVVTANMGSGYNNLGLILSYLGEVKQAKEAFVKALELRPDNGAIIRNLQDMDANGLIVRMKLYSRMTLD